MGIVFARLMFFLAYLLTNINIRISSHNFITKDNIIIEPH
jgi:hypothetical protein